MKSRYCIVAAVVVCALIGTHAEAAVTVYTDRTDFLNDVALLSGVNVLHEDFNGFTSDTPFQGTTLALNGFDVSGIGTAGTTFNLIDVSPFGSSGKQDIDGTTYLRGHHNENTRYYQMDFPVPALAWGGDIADVEQAGTNLLIDGITTLDLTDTGASGQQFIGVISDTPFSSLRAVGGGSGGDAVGIDNVVTVVPEPTTIALAALGALALLRQRRRGE